MDKKENKTKVFILECKEPIQDKEATTSCPKYKFAQVEINSVCVKCCYFKGIEKAYNTVTDDFVSENENWHNKFAVSCTFPMQRRIHKVHKIIKG